MPHPEHQAPGSAEKASERREQANAKDAAATDLEKRRSSGKAGQQASALDNMDFNQGMVDDAPPLGGQQDEAAAADPSDAQITEGPQQ